MDAESGPRVWPWMLRGFGPVGELWGKEKPRTSCAAGRVRMANAAIRFRSCAEVHSLYVFQKAARMHVYIYIYTQMYAYTR